MFHTPRKSYILFLAAVFPENCPSEEQILDSLMSPDEQQPSTLLFEDPPIEEFTAFEDDNSSESLGFLNYNNNAKIDRCDELDLSILTENISIVESTEYDDLPEYFINLISWPKTTNRLCWACGNRVHSVPWFIPLGLAKRMVASSNDDDNDSPADEELHEGHEMKAMKVHGCFCSPLCVRRYINNVKDVKIRNQWECQKLLHVEFLEILGRDVPDIPEAEDPTIMIQFCGSKKGITPYEYRLRNEAKLTAILDGAVKNFQN